MTNPMSRTNTRSAIFAVLFWLVMTASFLVVIEAIMTQQDATRRHREEQQFYTELSRRQQAGAIVELEELTALQQQAQALGLSLFELDYQVLYQRWLSVLQRFSALLRSVENRYLASDLDQQREELEQTLLALRDECDRQLRREPGSTVAHRWMIHNLRGAVSVLMAYSLLELAQDAERSQTFLGDAVDDFKQAIHAVDSSPALPAQRMVPRWNLELIVGRGESLLVGRSLGGDSLETLRGQLQVVLPNVGGFAPGVPLETRIRK